MAVMGMPAQIKTDNAPVYVSSKRNNFLCATTSHMLQGYHTTGEASVERANHMPKEMLVEQKADMRTPEISCIMLY